jgi:hypothetical protein
MARTCAAFSCEVGSAQGGEPTSSASALIAFAALAYSTESSVRIAPVPTISGSREPMTSLACAARSKRSCAVWA